MHDSIVNAFMYFFKSVGILALKEALDVLTKINNNGEICFSQTVLLVKIILILHLTCMWFTPPTIVYPQRHTYNQSNEIANGNTIFIPVGFDLYRKLRSETTKLIDDIALFGSIHKDRKKSYFLNRFYNNLSFLFANENTNIIKSYISKYGEFRSRNLSIPTI
jgi:hypothetical protein